jgi:hypothetical protein
LVESRRFTPELLPGYTAYIVTLTVLLAMGWYTLRRRSGHASEAVVQPADGEERAPGSAHEE